MREYKHWNIHKVNKTNQDEIISVELRDSNYDALKLYFKWDGCVNIHKRHNGYTNEDHMSAEELEENEDYMHVCDLKEFVDQLQEVLAIAKDMLGEEKYKEYFE